MLENISTHDNGCFNVSTIELGFPSYWLQKVFHKIAFCSKKISNESKSMLKRSWIAWMVSVVRFRTSAGIMYRSRTACKAKVVNISLNSGSIQSEDGMKIDRLKCSSAEAAMILFRVVWHVGCRAIERFSNPAILAIHCLVNFFMGSMIWKPLRTSHSDYCKILINLCVKPKQYLAVWKVA